MRTRSMGCLAAAIGASLSLPWERAPGLAGKLRDGTAVLGLAFGFAGSAAATIYTVDTTQDPAGPGGTTSLRQALYQANASVNNIVEFAPALNGSTITLQSGEIAVTQSMQITGPGADKLTISGNNASRIFHVEPAIGTSAAVTITGLTLTAGSTPGGGGAIYAYHAQLTTSHAVISHSKAHLGGAIFCYASDCTFTDMTVAANNADTGGGLEAFEGNMQVMDSVISGNGATGKGGGVEVNGSTGGMTNSRIVGNSAAYGAGIELHYGNFPIDQTTISGNTAADYGGGVYVSAGSLTITRSLVNGNSAANEGGGVAFHSAYTLYILDSTFVGNYGYIDGGGILTLGAANTLTVRNSTIVGNNTGGFAPGNGIVASSNNNVIDGCIVANNFSRGSGLSDLEGNFTFLYSLIKTPGTGNFTNGGGNITDGTDPQLGPLAVNGGPTLTMLPAAASVVINANSPLISGGIDQRGVPRVAGGRADMGAVERQSPEVMIFRNGFDSS